MTPTDRDNLALAVEEVVWALHAGKYRRREKLRWARPTIRVGVYMKVKGFWR